MEESKNKQPAPLTWQGVALFTVLCATVITIVWLLTS
jgi:hypothetical protein